MERRMKRQCLDTSQKLHSLESLTHDSHSFKISEGDPLLHRTLAKKAGEKLAAPEFPPHTYRKGIPAISTATCTSFP